MNNWQEIMEESDLAKRHMIVDETNGRKIFEELINREGPDGMIYFKRAEAFEALGQYQNALDDFRKARALIPMEKWKKAAGEGISRVQKDI